MDRWHETGYGGSTEAAKAYEQQVVLQQDVAIEEQLDHDILLMEQARDDGDFKLEPRRISGFDAEKTADITELDEPDFDWTLPRSQWPTTLYPFVSHIVEDLEFIRDTDIPHPTGYGFILKANYADAAGLGLYCPWCLSMQSLIPSDDCLDTAGASCELPRLIRAPKPPTPTTEAPSLEEPHPS